MPIFLGPLITAILARLTQAVATGALLTVAQEFLDGSFRQIIDQIKSEDGVTTDEAKDIASNILIDFAINTATTFVAIQTKIGLKLADFLGLSTKGFIKI